MLFTKTSISSIKPRKYSFYIVETGSTGFAVKVQPTGNKSFYYRKKLAGKRIDQFLGYDLETARRSYSQLKAHAETEKHQQMMQSVGCQPGPLNGLPVHQSTAPLNEQLLYYPGANFETLSNRFLKEHAEPNLKPATVRNYRLYIDKVTNELQHTALLRPTVSVQQSRSVLKRYLDELRIDTPVLSNRMKETLSSCFKWGVLEDICYSSPVYGIKAAKEMPRSRKLSPPEIRQFVQTLFDSGFDKSTAQCLLLVLSTGLRAGEALGLTPSNIDLNARQLVINEPKNGHQFLVPLSDFALLILSERMNGCPTNERLFKVSIYGLRQVCLRATIKASVTKCSTHDLRRTFATLAGSLGININVISRLLNHSNGHSVTSRVYALYDMHHEKREALSKISDELFRLSEGIPIIAELANRGTMNICRINQQYA